MKKFLNLGLVFCSLMVASSAFAVDAMAPATSAQQQGGAAIQSGSNTFQKDSSLNRNVYQDNYYESTRGNSANDGTYYHESYNQGSARGSYSNDAGSTACCATQEHPQDTVCCPADSTTGECWCLMCHQEPCYYNTYRCVEKPVYTCKKACRYVPRYYEVQRCKYVPQYYTETKCEQVPEYYDVEECTTCKEWVCDKQCKYVPKYYWKHTCGATAPCDQATAAACCRK
jgi:hypothetical protein